VNGNGERYVTYKWLFATVISAAVATAATVVTIGFGAWQVHASQPHHGAVETEEFNRALQGINGRFDRVQAEQSRQNTKLDRLLER